ncbi:MAG: SCO family protein [Paracoccus sp. (in: a-proteobacteria)]|nr:SCO family protein [Paracoccus sp. (in: a-proteobacteria)]
MNEKMIFGLGILATGLVLGTGALWLNMNKGDDAERFAGCNAGVVAGGTETMGGPFTLTNQTGTRVTDAQVFDKPSILYFGYTFCPDVCPMDVARNSDATEILTDAGRDVQSVFITVDPARDTPQALEMFAGNIDPQMVALTGSLEETDAVSRAWRNYYKINDDGTDYYLVDHATNSYLVLPEYGTVAFFRRDLEAEDMAERVACLMDAA